MAITAGVYYAHPKLNLAGVEEVTDEIAWELEIPLSMNQRNSIAREAWMFHKRSKEVAYGTPSDFRMSENDTWLAIETRIGELIKQATGRSRK